MAAEYIAAQFRRAGLEPVGDDGYFQTANYASVKPNPEGLQFTLGGAKAADGAITIQEAVATDLQNAPAFKVSLATPRRSMPSRPTRFAARSCSSKWRRRAGAGGFQAQRRLMTAAAQTRARHDRDRAVHRRTGQSATPGPTARRGAARVQNSDPHGRR